MSGDVTVRFIEYMPFDGQRLWGTEKVLSGKEILERFANATNSSRFPAQWKHCKAFSIRRTGEERSGLITSITEPFCSDCDRIRLSADGKIVPCLFDSAGYDLRPLLRGRIR